MASSSADEDHAKISQGVTIEPAHAFGMRLRPFEGEEMLDHPPDCLAPSPGARRADLAPSLTPPQALTTSVMFVEDNVIFYPVGRHLAQFNLDDGTMRFQMQPENVTGVTAMAMGGGRFLAICERTESWNGGIDHQITISDFKAGNSATKKARVLSDPDAGKFIDVSFSGETGHKTIVTISSNGMLLCWDWYKQKVVAGKNIMNGGHVPTRVTFDPTATEWIVTSGPNVPFKAFKRDAANQGTAEGTAWTNRFKDEKGLEKSPKYEGLQIVDHAWVSSGTHHSLMLISEEGLLLTLDPKQYDVKGQIDLLQQYRALNAREKIGAHGGGLDKDDHGMHDGNGGDGDHGSEGGTWLQECLTPICIVAYTKGFVVSASLKRKGQGQGRQGVLLIYERGEKTKGQAAGRGANSSGGAGGGGRGSKDSYKLIHSHHLAPPCGGSSSCVLSMSVSADDNQIVLNFEHGQLGLLMLDGSPVNIGSVTMGTSHCANMTVNASGGGPVSGGGRKLNATVQVNFVGGADGGMHLGPIDSMSACSTAPLLLTVSKRDKTMRLWNYITRQCLLSKSFADEGSACVPSAVSIHPTGFKAAAACNDKVALFDILHDRLVQQTHIPLHNCSVVAYSTGGGMLAVAQKKEVYVFSTTSTAQLARGVFLAKFDKHTSDVTSLRWDSNDCHLFSAGRDGYVYAWRIVNDEMQPDRLLSSKATVYEHSAVNEYAYAAVAVASDGMILAAGHATKIISDVAVGRGGNESVGSTGVSDDHVAGGGNNGPWGSDGHNNTDKELVMMAERYWASNGMGDKDGGGGGKGGSGGGGGKGGGGDDKVPQEKYNYHSAAKGVYTTLAVSRSIKGRDALKNKTVTAVFMGQNDGGVEYLPVTKHGSNIIAVDASAGGTGGDKGGGQSSRKHGAADRMTGVSMKAVVHYGQVSALCISMDSKLLFTAGHDGAIFVFKIGLQLMGETLIRPVGSLSSPLTVHSTTDAAGGPPSSSGVDCALVDRRYIQHMKSDVLEAKQSLFDEQQNAEYVKFRLINEHKQREHHMVEERNKEVANMQKAAAASHDHHMEETARLEDRMATMEQAHMTAAQELEILYERKLAAEALRNHDLLNAKEDINLVWMDERRRLEAQAEAKLAEAHEKHEREKSVERQKFNDMEARLKQLQLKYVEHMEQLEAEYELEFAQRKARTAEDFKRLEDKETVARSDLLRKNLSLKKETQKADIKERLLSKKDVEVVSLQNELRDRRAEVLELTRTIKEREHTLRDKEQHINDLKAAKKELDKEKFVLKFQLGEAKAELLPKEQRINELVNKEENLDRELENELKERARLNGELKKKTDKLENMAVQNKKQREVITKREWVINNIERQVSALFHDCGTDKRVKEFCIRILNKNIDELEKGTPQQIGQAGGGCGGGGTDGAPPQGVMAELQRQRNTMESAVDTLKKRVYRGQTAMEAAYNQKIAENTLIMEEVNNLRMENRALREQMRAKNDAPKSGPFVQGVRRARPATANSDSPRNFSASGISVGAFDDLTRVSKLENISDGAGPPGLHIMTQSQTREGLARGSNVPFQALSPNDKRRMGDMLEKMQRDQRDLEESTIAIEQLQSKCRALVMEKRTLESLVDPAVLASTTADRGTQPTNSRSFTPGAKKGRIAGQTVVPTRPVTGAAEGGLKMSRAGRPRSAANQLPLQPPR